MAEETGTTIVITGPESDAKRIVEVLHGANVPIMEGYPPQMKAHPDENAPDDLKVAVLMIDSRGWEAVDKAAADAAAKVRSEINRS